MLLPLLLLLAGPLPSFLSLAPTSPVVAAAVVPVRLFEAAAAGNAGAIRALLAGGAVVNAKDMYGRTALHFASESGRVAAIESLLADGGADIHAESSQGETALHYAGANGEVAAIEALVAGAAPDIESNAGRTPRDVAVRFGKHAAAELLDR